MGLFTDSQGGMSDGKTSRVPVQKTSSMASPVPTSSASTSPTSVGGTFRGVGSCHRVCRAFQIAHINDASVRSNQSAMPLLLLLSATRWRSYARANRNPAVAWEFRDRREGREAHGRHVRIGSYSQSAKQNCADMQTS